jgi:type IV pilus assembly protein PilV
LRRPAPARGFAMIEALVAILIFSIGVLGLVGLQISMSGAQTSAKFRSDAAYLANDLVGTIWADSTNLASYASANCSAYAPCKNWELRMKDALPGSSHEITTATTGDVTIRISWRVPNEGTHQFVTSTTIVSN